MLVKVVVQPEIAVNASQVLAHMKNKAMLDIVDKVMRVEMVLC